MQSSFNAHGRWWLPAHPETQISGELTVDPGDGPRLALHGAFIDPDSIALNMEMRMGRAEAELMLGRLDDGTAVTLYKNSATRIGRREMRISSRWALAGAHFAETVWLKFQTVSFRLKHLESWTGETPIERGHSRLITHTR